MIVDSGGHAPCGEGVQMEPEYPTVGLVVCEGEGEHIRLDGPEAHERGGVHGFVELGG